MNRFFLNQILDNEIIMIKDRAMVHQMRDVLKLRKGEKAVFFNANPECLGFDFIAELKNIEGVGHGGQAVFMFREKLENIREPSKKLILYQSLIKKDKFEWVLGKATEAGVSEIVPVISARSEKKSLNIRRCQMILKDSAEQSVRAIIPKLHSEINFEKAALMAQNSGHKTYFADLSEKDNKIHGAGDRTINLFIGPEGGWEERELYAANRAGFVIVSLGRLVLRSETAAVVASYTLLWG
ncbi:MAG: Ribosomal RNA small subunit methyltransferase E [Candidatus Giovannonibacteria bacterium GW2011_GWC2_43_8]|nr:MAG: Ribosomal RNA small subunit methyltransferase E [Candidatus Giovannonibacteria bacterium GW2011_GWC2_43_8]